MNKLASEVKAGDRFPSPRTEEGVVVAVEDIGRCVHDDRPDSVHVRNSSRSEFFIALIGREELHVCDDGCPTFLDEGHAEHLAINRHQR